MQISLIAAMAHNHVIGKDNSMPWHMPADLAHFKQLTLGKPVVMGRRTFESIGRALPGRPNIVLSSQTDLPAVDGVTYYQQLSIALADLQQAGTVEVMIIGGATLYSAILSLAHRMYLTFIDTPVEGDTFFPSWEPKEWQLQVEEKHPADENNPHPYAFRTYERV